MIKLFGLGLIKGTALGLTGGLIIGLVLKETCKQFKCKKKQNSQMTSSGEENQNKNEDF